MFFAALFLMKNMATEVLYCSVNTRRIAIIKATTEQISASETLACRMYIMLL
jgi:hypothetical protein